MSWSQRPGSAAPPERPPAAYPHQAQGTQPYNQQSMYPNYQGAAPPGNTQQQFWQTSQQPQPQYNQYGQAYQQDYQHNANQFYQQPPQFNQNYANQGYNNTQHQGYDQHYYQNQGVQQNFPQNKPKSDGWEDNWDWGWEESAKQAQNAASQNHSTAPPGQAPLQPVFNNANVIEESFVSTDTWNWSMEDKKEPKAPAPVLKQEPATLAVEALPVQNNSSNEPPAHSANNQSAQHIAEDVKTLSDRDVVKERMPNLALGKRFHLENLTPQWSIESQMSQESSDGPQTHSEGTYRSDNQSRNSSKSSPGPNTDNSNFNYSQSGLDEYPPSSEWSRQSNDDSTLVDNVQGNSRRESHDALSSSLQDMSIANRENPDLQGFKSNQETEGRSRNEQESLQPHGPSPSASANFPPPVSSMLPQPPHLSASTVHTPSSSSLPPPPSSSGILPPPTSFPLTSANTNPFKQSGPFSHKKVASASPSLQSFPPPLSSTNLTSPAAVSKVSQHRMPLSFGANLETTPDNSERPDQPAMTPFRPMPVAQQIPDNLEVAPQNDRNEYLQTAHLSSEDYGENTDFSRNVPPPGLRRMVVGQQETEYSQNLNISGDEPPPGLARMVPGQQTEADNSYNQPGDNYMDRHIDGQPTDTSGRPYRQADGQQTPDNYNQPSSNRSERRPIGLDRMVPGEPSNDEYSQYQGPNYASSNEQRVVMGVDHDYPVPADAGPSDIREQNVDGSDYSEQTPRNPSRNIIGAREASNNVSPDFNPAPEDQQREVTMEGENLQDLSAISSVDLQFSREQPLDGADLNSTEITAIKTDASDSNERPLTGSRRQSLNRVNTSGEESERDRAFKSSPRRDRDKHKSSQDRDRDRVRDKEGRYSRGDRKYDRDDRRAGDRRSEKERRDRDRKERDVSPDARRHKRSTRSHRYETEDTDYYSDRERERRRYREGSYASKPPRPDDSERRYDERERSRRYNTIERDRDRRYDDERDGAGAGASRARRDRRERDRYGQYRDIDPTRTYGNIRREEEDRRRVVTFSSETQSSKEGQAHSSGSRPGSREAPATDDDLNGSLVAGEGRGQRGYRDRDPRRARHTRQDPYYDGYGTGTTTGAGAGAYSDPYALQRQQYQYYEHLRLADPAAYALVYKQVMAGRAPPAPPTEYIHKYLPEGYGSLGYDARAEERTSVHSGRSSANGLKGNDTYYGGGAGAYAGSLRDAPSLRTDLSDRDLNTDASLNLGNLDTSTVRSERMTPCKFSTTHIKGNIGSRHVVVVRPMYPADGHPATVQILSLSAALAHEPLCLQLHHYPGPLVKGVTHKKSVIEYCMAQVRTARQDARDVIGYVLLWELLALLLRQNGVVVGTDIAELLMKNKQEYDYNAPHKNAAHNDSRRGSSQHSGQEERSSPDPRSLSTTDLTPPEDLSPQSPVDDKAALDRLREYLTYGNKQEALEWAMSNNLWGYALTLAAYCERRTRAGVAARFLASVPRADPLHTLLAHLQGRAPPAASCVGEQRWWDWRPHVAIMLSNNSAKPDQDRRTLTQLGDSLSSRGMLYSAQFCYISAGVHVSRHPLAPLQPAAGAHAQACPRLALLLADPRAASLHHLATDQAIFATEIYEYALSLNQDYVINELQVYKLILATRLIDVGMYERALAYVEQAARAVTRSPRDYSPALIAQLAELADRLKYHDPGLQEEAPPPDEAPSEEPSPRHLQWLDDVRSVAHMLSTEASQQNTPQHQPYPPPPPPADHAPSHQYAAWPDQAPQQPTYVEPEETPDYSQYYQQQQQLQQQQQQPQQQPEQQQQHAEQQQQQYGYSEDWQRTEEQHQTYADPYWQGDNQYGYGEAGAGAGAGAGAVAGAGDERPAITMPGTTPSRPALYADYDDDRPPSGDHTDRETDTPKPAKKQQDKSKDSGEAKGKGGGWLGGILTKLSLRPPNQMILPDDKNPTIVWDAEHKRWRNTDADEDEAPGAPPPPPSRLPHMNATSGSQPPAMGGPPTAPVSNIFKMQKGRHIKKSYVDVFNPTGAATRPLPPAAEVLGPAPPPASLASPSYFVPSASAAPTSDMSGMYDTSQLQGDDRYRQGGGM